MFEFISFFLNTNLMSLATFTSQYLPLTMIKQHPDSKSFPILTITTVKMDTKPPTIAGFMEGRVNTLIPAIAPVTKVQGQWR